MATAKRTMSGRMQLPRERSMEVLPPEDADLQKIQSAPTQQSKSEERPSSSGSARSGQRALQATRVDSASRRTTAPSKQVSLQAVKRRTEDEDVDINDFSWREHTDKAQQRLDELSKLSAQRKEEYKNISDKLDSESANGEATASSSTMDSASSSSITSSSANESEIPHPSSSKAQLNDAATKFQKYAGKLENKKDHVKKNPVINEGVNIEDSDQFDTDLEESESSSGESEEEEKPKAPNELLMEFVDCMMKADYVNAQKLCKMILIYEPEHPEAKKFQGLIEEKIKLEEEKANQGSSEEESSSDDDDDSDEDDNSEIGSGDDSSESESSNDDESENKENLAKDLNKGEPCPVGTSR